ncbi:MAG: EamA family transporter [Rhizonema sp. NSF051]|nr:EamA family transporter [Rhizonema sp. NSF051]
MQKWVQAIRVSSGFMGLAAIILTVVLWAIAANVATSLFLAGVPPFEVAGIGTMIATFGLAIVDSFFGQSPTVAPRESRTRKLSRQEFAAGISLAGLVGLDYLAIQQLSVAVAIVLLFTAPILVVLWSALTSRQVPSRSVLVTLILSVVGVVLVSNVLASDARQVSWLGIGIGLLAAVFFAAYIILLEKLSETRESSRVLLTIFAVASLFWLTYQLSQGIPIQLLTPKNFSSIVYIGFAGILLPYLLFFWCIQRVQAERAAIAATLEPFIAGVLAWICFGQVLTPLQITGGVLIIAAVTWLQIKDAKPTSL